MKTRKARLAFVLFTALALLLTSACGSGSGTPEALTESSNSTGASTSLQAASNQTATESSDPLGKYDPPIKVTVPNMGFDPNIVKLKDGDTIGNDLYTRVFSDRLGIQLEYPWVAAGEAANQKLNIMIASGGLPDILKVNQQQYEQLIKADKIADLTDSYEKYATPYTKKYLSGDYSKSLDILKKDGKIYGIPNYQDYHEVVSAIWVRSDWLTKLNLQVPKTADELFKAAEMFTTQDPDGNGVNDTYGIAMDNTGLGGAYWNIFHSYPGIWIKDASGKLAYGMYGSSEQVNATKLAFQKLQQFYRDGIIKKDFAMMDANKRNADLVAGKCGIVFGTLGDGYYPLQQTIDKDPKADFIPIPVPSIDDKPTTMSANPVTYGGIYVVKKGFAHPEALVKMLNLFHDLNNNPETMEFEKYNTDPVDNNMTYMISAIQIFNPTFNIEGYEAITKVLDGQADLSSLPPCYKLFYDQIKAYYDKNDRKQWCAATFYGKGGSCAVAKYYLENKSHVLNEFTGSPTPEMIKKQPQLDKLWMETMMKVIMGTDLSEFDRFVEKAKTIGGDEIAKEVNDWYAQ